MISPGEPNSVNIKITLQIARVAQRNIEYIPSNYLPSDSTVDIVFFLAFLEVGFSSGRGLDRGRGPSPTEYEKSLWYRRRKI